MSVDTSTRIVVVELDGATWAVADELMDAGRLPHLERIMRCGARGVLRSLEPMLSPALWATIYTGKTTAEHGIVSFSATSNSVRCKRLWDILAQAGITIGLMGSFTTWPPQPFDSGFVVPDYVTALSSQTFPPHLKCLQEMVLDVRLPRGRTRRHLRLAWQLLRTGVHPIDLIRGGLLLLLDRTVLRALHEVWRKALTIEAMRAEAFIHLYKRYRPRFATFHYHAIDTIGHRFWQYYEPSAFDIPLPPGDVRRYRLAIPHAYIQADRLIGHLLKVLDQDTTLVVLSDHGQGACREVTTVAFLDLATLVSLLGIQDVVVPVRTGVKHYLHFQDRALMRLTEQRLQGAFVAQTGEPVFCAVNSRGHCLSFEVAQKAFPGMDRSLERSIVVSGLGRVSMQDLRVRTGSLISSRHTPDGLVVLYGRHVPPGNTLRNASILDVTPTILALFGLPVARDMKGRVWWEVLDLDRSRVEEYVDTYDRESNSHGASPVPLTADELALLRDRLCDLGYL
jgi:predicted AlkP superfamily phosphohydrolase/phosphomutase